MLAILLPRLLGPRRLQDRNLAAKRQAYRAALERISRQSRHRSSCHICPCCNGSRRSSPLIRDLDVETVRGEAAEILSILADRLTIYPDGNADPEGDVVAMVVDVLAFATNDNAAREGGVMSSCGIWLRGQDLNL